jgi:hypothetical protein
MSGTQSQSAHLFTWLNKSRKLYLHVHDEVEIQIARLNGHTGSNYWTQPAQCSRNLLQRFPSHLKIDWWLSTRIQEHQKTNAYPLTVTNYLLCRKNPLQKQTQMPSHIMYMMPRIFEVITIGLFYQKEKQTTFFFWVQHITTHDTILQCLPLRLQTLCPCIVMVAEKANEDSCHQWIV